MADEPLVLAITGGSGVAYGCRLLDALLRAGHEVHLSISPSAVEVFAAELDARVDLARFEPSTLTNAPVDRLRYWHYQDLRAGIASGSFRTRGMAIVPCSMSTLAAIASGITTNLIQRAADVHLKERRKLVLVPREAPIGLVGLKNMVAVTEAGGVILPASPGFYHRPRRIEDLVDFVVSRIADQLGAPLHLVPRWGESNDRS